MPPPPPPPPPPPDDDVNDRASAAALWRSKYKAAQSPDAKERPSYGGTRRTRRKPPKSRPPPPDDEPGGGGGGAWAEEGSAGGGGAGGWAWRGAASSVHERWRRLAGAGGPARASAGGGPCDLRPRACFFFRPRPRPRPHRPPTVGMLSRRCPRRLRRFNSPSTSCLTKLLGRGSVNSRPTCDLRTSTPTPLLTHRSSEVPAPLDAGTQRRRARKY